MFADNRDPKTLKHWRVLAELALAPVLLFMFLAPAQAADPAQPIYTPTALPDGRVFWIVKENDTLLSISLITGVPLQELRSMNNLSGDMINVGQQILIGRAGPAEITPTLGPTPTPTEVLPSPTPTKPGFATLCVLLFEDVNGDSIRQEEELSIPDGAISVNNRSGTISLNATTVASDEPHCFEGIMEGEYTISVAVPSGYNATTQTSFVTRLKADLPTYKDFGAQRNAQNQSSNSLANSGEGEKSPLLGIFGWLLLLVGIGLGVYSNIMVKKR